MGISALKAALINQSIEHLGADVQTHDLNILDLGPNPDPDYTAGLDLMREKGSEAALKILEEQLIDIGVAQRIENPENTYDEEYGNKWFQNQYGDGGYCMDMLLYGLDRIYRAAEQEPDIPMTVGLGTGTYNFHQKAVELGANVSLDDVTSFQTGNIITMSGSAEWDSGKPYDGHAALILSAEMDVNDSNIMRIQVLEANAYSRDLEVQTNLVSNALYNQSTGMITFVDSNWQIIEDEKPVYATSIVDPDLFPKAQLVSDAISKNGYTPERPDNGSINERFADYMKAKANAALLGEEMDATFADFSGAQNVYSPDPDMSMTPG